MSFLRMAVGRHDLVDSCHQGLARSSLDQGGEEVQSAIAPAANKTAPPVATSGERATFICRRAMAIFNHESFRQGSDLAPVSMAIGIVVFNQPFVCVNDSPI
jgi:hypothetical protein